MDAAYVEFRCEAQVLVHAHANPKPFAEKPLIVDFTRRGSELALAGHTTPNHSWVPYTVSGSLRNMWFQSGFTRG